MDENKNLAGLNQLSDKARNEALSKYLIIHPFLQKAKTLTVICQDKQLPLRTLRRWVTNYRNNGLAGLARKSRQDKGSKRCCSSELQQLIEGLHLQQEQLSNASIYRKIKDYAIKSNSPYPSYRTVCKIISQLPASMTTLAHHGSKVYKQQFDLLCSHEASRSNELWQADHVLLDILILQMDDKEKAARPWLTVILDDYSRAIAGYELSFLAPSATKTALCLRQAIWRKNESQWSICGIPSTLYTDHGSDFTSQHIEQVCIDLKVELIFSTVGEPRGRGKIERFFRTLNQLLLSELNGYTGSKDPIARLTLAELDKLVRAFIIEYNQRLHPSIQETPKDRWEAGGFLPLMPDSIEQLDLLLLTVAKSRMIRRDGIWFQGLRYLDPLLADYVGESVIIRYDPADVTSIRVFYKNQYLCQPICQALVEQSVSLKEIQMARVAKRKNLQTQINQRVSLVDAILNSKKEQQNSSVKLAKKPAKKIRLKLYATDE